VQHCEDEDLSLLAVGEPPSAEVDQHLRQCLDCRRRLGRLRDVVTLARDVDPVAIVPPPSVWAGIAAATGVTAAPRPERVAAGASSWSAEVPDGDPEPERRARRQQPPRTRRGGIGSWRSRRSILSVAAAGLVVGALAGSGVTMLLDDDTHRTQVIVATSLDGLAPDPQATGEASVVRTSQGGRLLEIDVSELGSADDDGFYEVWLIDPSVQRMIPVGILTGATGQFVLPEGLDLAEFPVVDVSIEPLDGDPKHSGKSILRGSIGA
jgi:hypothetical protein